MTRDEALARAAALVPVLRARAAETERLRQIPAETVRDLIASQLIRIGNPQRYGGHGTDYDLMFDVAAELARGDGSAAWCYAVWTVHNWWVGYFPEQAQNEYFAGGPDVLASSALNLREGRAEPVPGGYRVSGHWTFSSGCDAATWAFVGLTGPSGPLWGLLPRADYAIEDHWFVSGMQGTGSKDLVAHDVFVPAYRTLNPATAGDGDYTGWELHGRLSYRAPMRCLTGWDLAAPVIGMAQGAIDIFTARLMAGGSPTRPAESAPGQLRLAEASAEVAAARALHQSGVREILRRAEQRAAFTPLDRARYQRDKAFAVKLSVQAVNRLFDASGGRATALDEPIQRYHRDINAASHHGSLVWDLAAEEYGRQALGLEPKFPR